MSTVLATLYPLNDFCVIVRLQKINQSTGERTPLTSGTVTAFLATSEAPTATPAHATLEMTPVHIENGKWLVFFDASVLTAALLASLFSGTPPFLIVQETYGTRTFARLAYSASKEGSY